MVSAYKVKNSLGAISHSQKFIFRESGYFAQSFSIGILHTYCVRMRIEYFVVQHAIMWKASSTVSRSYKTGLVHFQISRELSFEESLEFKIHTQGLNVEGLRTI